MDLSGFRKHHLADTDSAWDNEAATSSASGLGAQCAAKTPTPTRSIKLLLATTPTARILPVNGVSNVRCHGPKYQ